MALTHGMLGVQKCCAERCLCCPQDMTTLSYLNEPGVLWNLKCRYVLDTIYTYTGSILIAVNPFQRLPHLYGPHMMEQYRGRALGELDPHVYAIADSAYRQMRTEGKSQSILVRTTISFQHKHTQQQCGLHVLAEADWSNRQMPGTEQALHSDVQVLMKYCSAMSTELPGCRLGARCGRWCRVKAQERRWQTGRQKNCLPILQRVISLLVQLISRPAVS